MAPRHFTIFCFAALVQLFGLQITAVSYQEEPIKLTVLNEIFSEPVKVYEAFVRPGGILLGAMRKLQETNQGFKFTVTDNIDYGFYLESINGVAGNDADHTYWQILSDIDGTQTPTPMGVGCYMPKANEHIIFKFTKW